MAFHGHNIRLARVFQNMTQLELANAVSASEAANWQVERGREPSETLLQALAIVLKVEPQFFYDTIIDEFTEADCHFRKGHIAAEKVRKRVLAQATMQHRALAFLNMELDVLAPVFADDTIHVDVEVVETRVSRSRPDRGLVRTRNEIVKQDGTKVITYTPLRMVKRRTEAHA